MDDQTEVTKKELSKLFLDAQAELNKKFEAWATRPDVQEGDFIDPSDVVLAFCEEAADDAVGDVELEEDGD
jgi:hypothetical protein